MRLNLSFIVLVAANFAAALPFNKNKENNPYLVCKSNDSECIDNQLTLCSNEYSTCIKRNISKGHCNFIRKQCKELEKYYSVTESDEGTEEEITEKYTVQNTFEPTKDNVKIIGRANYQDGYLWFGLTDSGIEYSFNGKTTTINVTADATAYSEDMPARIIIYADGNVYNDTVITQKITDFTVDFNRPGKHIVRFLKVSEAERGSIRINEISSDAKVIKPTAQKKLKIEFIGDSITCAYGVDGTLGETFSTRTEDGTKSYAFKTAQKFHADYSIVAYSGFSILSCISFDGGRTPDSTVPPIYDRLGFSFGPNEFDDGVFQLQENKWDQQQFIPDLVVINLGTNDHTYFQTIDPSKVPSETEAFIEAYEDFIAQIRNLYPNARILCVLGMMGQEVFPQIEEAVQKYTTKTGDELVKTFKLNVQNEEKNGLGIDGHPNTQSQIDATKELVGAIEDLFGWKSDPKVNIEL